jgi:uncharacterized repeat protein (TIGR01451 family)
MIRKYNIYLNWRMPSLSGYSEITKKIITRTFVILLAFILGITAFGSYHSVASADTGPDLIVQSISLSPGDPSIGVTVTITVTIKNQGSAGAERSHVECQVDGIILDTKSINPLDAGATAAVTFTWKAEVGSHTIKAVADSTGLIAETNENNNTTTYTLTTSAPDLIVKSITWSPDNPSRGDSIVFSITIKNQGSLASHNTNVHFYIDGISRGFQDIAAIDPGGAITTTFNWIAMSGQHIVKAVIDEPNNVKESDETNNELEVNFSTLLPDLTIHDISWSPEDPSNYDEVTFSVNVTNQGSGRSDSCLLAYYIDGLYQTLIPVASINASSSSNISFTWLATDNAHEFKAIIDYNQEVTESDETNNEKTVSLSTLPPDLVVDDITWLPADAAVGDNVTFNATIKNQGAGRAEASRAICYIDGQGMGYLNTPEMDSGNETIMSIPWVAKNGSHYIKVIADCDNQLVESDENNNELTKTFPIIPPDLVITGITFSPENPAIGDTITFKTTLKNQGGGIAENFKVAYFLDDTLLNKDTIYHLEYDTSANTTCTWKSQSGHHIFKAFVDCDNSIAESDENNNESSVTVAPDMPDLAVTNISWSPHDMPAGSSITFDVTIENLGSLSAGPSHVAYYVDDAIVSDTEIEPLDAGATTTKDFLWIAMEGYHTVKIVIDSNNKISEIDETNNTREVNLPPPDLIVQDITCSPSDAKIGDNVTITATIKNQGNSPTQTSQVACDVDGLYIASQDLPEINAGGSVTRIFKWVAEEGVHSIIITADTNNLVTEADETNNDGEIEFSTLTPDLIIKDISWIMESPLIYDEVNFTITIENQGTGDAGSCQLQYFIDETPAVVADIAPIPAGGIVEYKFASTLKRGPHTVNAAIDVNNEVTELDETNNEGFLAFSTTVPDLIIKSIACAPLNANVGDNVIITVKVENQGRDKALKPRLALSIDGSPADYVEIPEINMGATATANFTWKATAGSHEISATADVDQTVLESNETNNTKSNTIIIGAKETPPGKPANLKTSSSASQGFLGSYWWLLMIGAALLGALALMSALIKPKRK